MALQHEPHRPVRQLGRNAIILLVQALFQAQTIKNKAQEHADLQNLETCLEKACIASTGNISYSTG